MVETDKLLHFWISFAIAFFKPGLAMIAGVGKEIIDVVTGGVADVYDLAADGLGIFFAVLISPFA
ncbi:MAG: hypothetical protein HUU46_16370 [Candidatus Hydrogenedentes bacterium]|nr:hypothetical protein [Candidatus Hydrogenedentota bacterium]